MTFALMAAALLTRSSFPLEQGGNGKLVTRGPNRINTAVSSTLATVAVQVTSCMRCGNLYRTLSPTWMSIFLRVAVVASGLCGLLDFAEKNFSTRCADLVKPVLVVVANHLSHRGFFPEGHNHSCAH